MGWGLEKGAAWLVTASVKTKVAQRGAESEESMGETKRSEQSKGPVENSMVHSRVRV